MMRHYPTLFLFFHKLASEIKLQFTNENGWVQNSLVIYFSVQSIHLNIITDNVIQGRTLFKI